MGKILKIQKISLLNNPFIYENEAVIEQNIMYDMFEEFKRYVNNLDYEDIVDVVLEDGYKKYTLCVNFLTAVDDMN